jgi:group I intron endonuclease
MISGIYAIVNKINGHCYIGSSWNIDVRYKKHESLLDHNKHHSRHLQSAWNKYGRDNFVCVVLHNCLREELLQYEQNYINKVMPEYNICIVAGSKAGVPRTDEEKIKISLSLIGKSNGPRSEETKRKISIGNTGKVFTEEHKRNMINSRIGYTHSEETKLKISTAGKGRKQTEDDRHKKSIAAMGNQRTLGLVHTEETKRKMSEARKEYWARKNAAS